MAKTYSIQTSFNSGVLDTRLSARVDVKQYYQGMSVGDNVLCLPQGGVRRRPGMEFIADPGEFSRVVPFVFNVDQTYLLVFRNNAVDIYRDDVFKATVVTTYTAAELMDIRFAQSADTMILVHENHAPALFQRQGDDVTWSLTDISFGFIPQFDFNDTSSPAATSEIQDVTWGGFVEGQLFKLTLDGIDTDDISFSTDTSTTANNILIGLQGLLNLTPSDITVAHQAGAVYRVTLSGSNAKPWNLLTGRFTSGTSGTVTSSRVQTGVARSEDVWSATRGWPKTVTFHEGRLWFGASTSRPITLWGSGVNDFFNFDPGKSRDDQSINVTLDVDQYDEIRGVFSGRHLQVFTSGAEFYVNKSPITPENIAVTRQTGFGSKNIQPKTIDGATIFVQRTGRSLREFVFDFAEEAYLSNTASLLAPELLSDPVDFAVSVGTDNEDANYIYVVNADGTMAVYNTLRSQNVAGWSTWTTAGEIQNITSLVDDIYVVTKRTINSVDQYYVEKLNDNSYSDSSVLYTSPGTATLTGLTHLNDEPCVVRADGAVMNDGTPAAGQLTIERVATDSAEIGLSYSVTVTTMPVEKDIGPGYNLNGEKRIVNAMVYLQDSLGVKVSYSGQEYDLSFRTFGVGVLDQPVTPFTGKKEIYLLGWDKSAKLTIKQDDPAPMTLLALSLEMEFS